MTHAREHIIDLLDAIRPIGLGVKYKTRELTWIHTRILVYKLLLWSNKQGLEI